MADAGHPSRSEVEAALRAADEFFMGVSKVHLTANKLVARLREGNIDFAIAGALALNVHGVRRMTEDVDVLITPEGLKRFKESWLERGYIELRPGGKPVRDTKTGVRIDFLVTGEYPGDRLPKPVQFPNPRDVAEEAEDYPVVTLPRFIELKLASGISAKHRLNDLADVIRLIRARQLPLGFQDRLNPYVRTKFAELWEVAQTPDDDY